MPLSLKGMGVALATPFTPDFSIDFNALEALVERQIAGGAAYLAVLATTSEASTLTASERARVARFVAECVAGRIPLILGMSGNCTTQLTAQLADADLSGYSGVLSVVPYYNKPSQEGIYRHFKALAEASPVPVVLYNVPSRTGRNMEAATTLRLAHEFPGRIVGIKEASGSLDQVEEIVRNAPEGFQVVSGDDSLARRMIALGAVGVISVVGNALPSVFSRMIDLALTDPDSAEARKIDTSLQALDKALFAECNPSGLKCLLNLLGMAEDVVRLPLVSVGEATRNAIASALNGLPAAPADSQHFIRV